MHLGRCVGALNIGEAVTSLQAPGFLLLQDKKALFGTRIMVNCCILVVEHFSEIFKFQAF